MIEWSDKKGGLQSQVQSYYIDFWKHFGINALDIWDLPANEFFGMATDVDMIRAEEKKRAAHKE